MDIPLHVRLRRGFRSFLYTLLSSFIKQETSKELVDPREIQTILIVRPNYRIGNLIFLTPLIEQLQKNIPNVQIDIIVGLKLAGDILQEIPSVDNVFALPRDVLYKPHKLFTLIKNVRAKKYDLVLNISGGSFSSQLVTLLTRAKYKASFENKKRIIPLTHSIEKQNLFKHSGSQPLELLRLFPFELPKTSQQLNIFLTPKEEQKGKEELEKLLQTTTPLSSVKTVAIFRNARFDKKIEDSWWTEWFEALRELDNNIVVIDVLSPDIPAKLHQDMLQYQNKNLRILGAFFKATSLYISADTGPLHLALASNAKTLALFNKTSKEVYGTLGDENLTLDINNLSPKDVALKTYQLLKGKNDVTT